MVQPLGIMLVLLGELFWKRLLELLIQMLLMLVQKMLSLYIYRCSN